MKRINYLQIMATTCAVAILCNGCASMHPATRAQVATQSGLMLGSGFGAALGDTSSWRRICKSINKIP